MFGLILGPILFAVEGLLIFAFYNPVVVLQHFVLISMIIILALLISGELTFKEIWVGIKKGVVDICKGFGGSVVALCHIIAAYFLALCFLILYMYIYDNIFGVARGIDYYYNKVLKTF